MKSLFEHILNKVNEAAKTSAQMAQAISVDGVNYEVTPRVNFIARPEGNVAELQFDAEWDGPFNSYPALTAEFKDGKLGEIEVNVHWEKKLEISKKIKIEVDKRRDELEAWLAEKGKDFFEEGERHKKYREEAAKKPAVAPAGPSKDQEQAIELAKILSKGGMKITHGKGSADANDAGNPSRVAELADLTLTVKGKKDAIAWFKAHPDVTELTFQGMADGYLEPGKGKLGYRLSFWGDPVITYKDGTVEFDTSDIMIEAD